MQNRLIKISIKPARPHIYIYITLVCKTFESPSEINFVNFTYKLVISNMLFSIHMIFVIAVWWMIEHHMHSDAEEKAMQK